MRLLTLFCASLLLLFSACDSTPDGPQPGEARIAPVRPAYPLRVSANQRYLVDRTGAPVLLHGEAAWSAIVNLSRADIDRYLADRRAKGFNALYVNLTETAFSNQTPPWRNVNGDDPFTDTVDGSILDFSKPNEAYWRHADYFLEKADDLGFVVFVFPAYAGWQQGFDGWSYALDANGPDRMRAHGEFLGARYADRPNLIWAAGGDWGPTGTYDLVDEHAALAEGIRATDGDQLWTGHGGQESGIDAYGYLGLDLNTTYRYPPASVPDAVYLDYQRTPTVPFLFFEGWYENEYSVPVRDLRYQAYSSLLGGAFGQFYGNNPIWLFGDGWEAALDDPGAQDMVHVGDLLRSRPFHRLVPDYDHALVPENYGDRTDGSYVAAALADDGSTAVVYVPDGRDVLVDLGLVTGSQARAWCFDPKDGTAEDLGTFSTLGRETFTPCAAPDWVLVLDNARLNRPAPGTR